MIDTTTISHRELLDSFDENIALIDYSGNIIHVNEAWESFYRINAGGRDKIWAGTNYLDVCAQAEGTDSDEARDAYEGIRSVIDRKTDCFELEYPCHCPTEERWFLLRVTRMAGSQPLILVAHINITSRKSAEETVLKQNQLLERINADLESLVYKVTHDIKSPVNSIKGLINLSKMVKEEEELRAYLDLMGKSIGHLGGYIQDIIEMSRSTKYDPIPSPVRFDELLHEIVDSVGHMEEMKAVDVDVSVTQKEAFHCDRRLIHTVLGNLITNAVTYYDAEKEAPRVGISAAVQGARARIVVEDNGQGIEPRHLEKIFQKFYRANTSRQGSGLGLFLVKESVDRLRGTIDIESEPGTGTRCTLMIPEMRA